MKKVIIPILVAVACFSLLSCKKDSDEPENIITKTVTLSGAQEVPAVTTNATGTMNLTYNKDTKKLDWTVTWSNLSSNSTMAHFHGPASPTTTAPAVVVFTNFPTTSTSGTYNGTITLDATTEAPLLANQWYVNIHSQNFPAGELRGNIIF